MFVHLSRQLTIRHFVGRFLFNDAATKFLALEALDELSLGFTGTKDQHGIGISNTRDHLVVEFLEMRHELPLKTVLRHKVILRILVFRS